MCKKFYLPILLLIVSCANEGESYYPLISGYVWHYSIQEFSATEVRRKKEIIQNIGTEKGAFIQKSFMGAKSYLEKNEHRLRITQVVLENGDKLQHDEYTSTVLNYPIKIGKSWSDIIVSHIYNSAEPGSQHVIEAIPVLSSIKAINDVVKVPAGKFYQCLRIESTGEKFIREGKYAYQPKMTIIVKNTRWFAPGIGLVKETQTDESNIHMYPLGGFIKELVSFDK